MSKSLKVVLLILLVLTIDQVSKIYIKTNFAYGETYSLASWAKIHFVENPGMAFGRSKPEKLERQRGERADKTTTKEREQRKREKIFFDAGRKRV